jgi:hypothetical protein
VITNCFGLPWGDLEGLFLKSLLPLLELVLPAAHVLTRVLLLREENVARTRESLSILPR